MSLDRTVSTEELLSAFDVGGRTAAEHIGTEALLFQTGYLTITVEESSSHGRLDWRCAPAGTCIDRARCFRSDVTDVSLAIGGLDDRVGAVEAPQVVRGDALRVDGIREVREVHRGKRLPVSQAEVMGDQRGFVSGGLAREVSFRNQEFAKS